MRAAIALALVAALTGETLAQDKGCTMTDAVYTDGELGYELRFRKSEPWELWGMRTSVYELTLPDGRQLWGDVHTNMGTSRDIGTLHYGCDRPGPEDPDLTDEQLEACRIWHNNIYAIVGGKLAFVPNEGEPAPESLVLADLGRTLRYSVLTNPGDEPWDQFFLKGCGT